LAKKKDTENPPLEISKEENADLTEQQETKVEEQELLNDAEDTSYTLTAEEFEAARKHIESLTKERDETVVLAQRIQADFDNYRRRNESIRASSFEEGKRDTILQLLTVLDSFDRALDNEDSQSELWAEGVKLTIRQLYEKLEKLGMSMIDTNGLFDPALHEAVMQESVEGKESGEIIAVMQKGYQVGDRIIRHSMVKVAE